MIGADEKAESRTEHGGTLTYIIQILSGFTDRYRVTFTIIFISIFFTVFHYHLEIFGLGFYLFNMNIYTLHSNPRFSNIQKKITHISSSD